ncbi:hypothetical protein KSP39_PZI002991 [Platanthera zijinensis]|uniref:Myb/SANT-like domain-containing protein n=1 Tax=Platanthera zijinensis TaxID=2320716 RepID=A0AAP0BW39_9ASPA
MGKPKEGGISANWESSHVLLYCDLCIREIELGNRPTTHFSKDGWKNLVTKFKERTGLLYDRAQLKNKWDQLKREWKLWRELKKGETGLGWDPIKKTIDASDEWWQERIQMIPMAKKFRYSGIAPELEEKLDRMFSQVVASGDNVWIPATGSMPSIFLDDGGVVGNEDNGDENDRSFVPNIDDIAPSGIKDNIPKKLGKRKKKDIGLKQEILSRVDDLVESSRSVGSRMSAPILPPSVFLLDEVVEELERHEEISGDPELYDFATVYFLSTVNRAMFLKLPAHKRIIWLKNRHTQSIESTQV